MKAFYSFRGVLILSVVVIHAIVTPMLFSGILLYVEKSYQSQFIENVRAMSNLLAAQVAGQKRGDNGEALELYLDDLMLGGQLSYISVGLQGGITIMPQIIPVDHIKFVEDFFFGEHDDRNYFIAVPIRFGADGMPGIVKMGFDESLVQENIDTSYQRGTVLAIAYLVFMLSMVFFLVPRVTSSLSKLRDAANRIASGNAQETLDINSRISEFGSLAQDLEHMRYELVQQTQQIQAREAFISAVMENMVDAMIIVNDSLRIEEINVASQRAFLMGAKQLVDRPLTELFQPECRASLEKTIRGFMQDQGKVFYRDHDKEWLARRADGSQFIVELGISKMSSGQQNLLICNLHDISQRKETENALINARYEAEQANISKSLFLSTMSHELRTPLNAVIGYSEILLEDAEDRQDKQAIKDLGRINAAGTHLLSLINKVLDLSKIEAGRMELELDYFNIAEVLKEIADTTSPLVERNHNELVLVVDEKLATMYADITKFKQTVINIVGNAAKFTENGTIVIHAQGEQQEGADWLRVSISDSGIGISEEQQQRLFQNFTQADAGIARKYGGTGLGLSISQRFCELMGGRISVDSTLGEGTTFTIQLPLKVEDVEVED